MAEPDLGTAALLVVVLGAMAFVAGMPLRLMAVPTVMAAAAMVFAKCRSTSISGCTARAS